MGARRARTSRLVVSALAVSVAMTACSSTQDVDEERARAAGGGEETLAPGAPMPVPTGADGAPLTKEQIQAAVKEGKLPPSALEAVGGAPVQGGGQNPGTSSGAAARPGNGGNAAAAPPKPAVSGVSSGKSGPGFTATEIKIGLSVFKPGSMSDQLGIDAGFGNGQKQAEAVVAYINAKGGIAGRKVKPVLYTVDFGRDPSSFRDGQFEAEACEKWTNDDRVFAAVNNAMSRVALLPCLAKKGVPGIHDGMPIDERRLAPYRDFYYSGVGGAAMTFDRIATVVPRQLAAAGFYRPLSATKPTVVGIVHYDDEFYRSIVEKKMVPLLKSLGVKKVVVQAAPYAAQANHQAFVSRFQSEGVTHVQFLGEANLYPTFFMPAAENQQFRPKYGISTEQTPSLLQATQPIPREQLKNATGIGWSQLADVDNANDPGPTGPNDRLCLDIQKRAGQDMSERGARLTATMYCDGIFFLKRNLDKAASLTPAALAQAVSGLGGGYDSPGLFNPTRYSALKHDGAAAYRDFGFRNGAFVYTSGVKRMP